MALLRQIPFKKTQDGVTVKLASGKAVPIPRDTSIIFDDVLGSKITITMADNLVTMHTTSPDIPGGIAYEFTTSQMGENGGESGTEAPTLESFVGSLRCQANGRL